MALVINILKSILTSEEFYSLLLDFIKCSVIRNSGITCINEEGNTKGQQYSFISMDKIFKSYWSRHNFQQ